MSHTIYKRSEQIISPKNTQVANEDLRYSTPLHARQRQIKTTIIYHYMPIAAAAAKSLQSYLTLCDPIDGSPPGSPIPGILQARILGCHFLLQCMKVKVKSLSRVRLLATPRTVAHQLPWNFPGKSAGVECHCLL